MIKQVVACAIGAVRNGSPSREYLTEMLVLAVCGKHETNVRIAHVARPIYGTEHNCREVSKLNSCWGLRLPLKLCGLRGGNL